MNAPTPAVTDNAAASRFEVAIDGHLAVAEYRLRPGVLQMTHTEVPEALAGRGLAGQLVQAAIARARREGLKIDPQCRYVAGYLDKRPELHALRVGG